MKNSILLCSMFSTSVFFAQTNDSIAMSRKVETYLASQFAIARPINLEFSNISSAKYTSKLNGIEDNNHKVAGYSQIKASINTNFIKKQKWLLGATIGYNLTSVLADVVDPGTGKTKAIDKNFHYLFSSVNFNYLTKIFNRTTIFSSSVIVDGSEKHIERAKGIVNATMILKKTERTQMMLGLLVLVDPSSQVPIAPTFTLLHQFKNGIIIDIIFPKQLLLRKHIFNKARLSLGSELNGNNFYIYNTDWENTTKKYEYRQSEINNGLIYEHLLGENFILTGRVGIKSFLASRIVEKNENFNNPIFSAKPKSTFYFNIGLSFNPFIKNKK